MISVIAPFRQTGRQTETDRKTGRQADRQTDRQDKLCQPRERERD